MVIEQTPLTFHSEGASAPRPCSLRRGFRADAVRGDGQRFLGHHGLDPTLAGSNAEAKRKRAGASRAAMARVMARLLAAAVRDAVRSALGR